MIFDARMSELAGYRPTLMSPIWDCKKPLNVNDSDLRKEMTEAPRVQALHTDSIFLALRSELTDFVRSCNFHLDFTNPILKPLVKDLHEMSEESELVAIKKKMEDKYFKSSDSNNPLHMMTVWTMRGYLARCQLSEYFSRYSSPSVPQTDSQRDVGICYAIEMLDCDTAVLTSELTQGFVWLTPYYFQFMAYMHLVQNLIRRPGCSKAELVWEAMSNNAEARFQSLVDNRGPLLQIFSQIILKAWDARTAAFEHDGEEAGLPRIVVLIKQKIEESDEAKAGEPFFMDPGIDFSDFSAMMSMNMGTSGFPASGPGVYPNMQGPVDGSINPGFWPSMGWNMMNSS
jgi:hypothetical protein